MPDNSNSGNQGGSQKPSLTWSQPAAAQNGAKNAGAAPAANQPKNADTSSARTAATSAGSSMGSFIGIFVAGIIVGALIGWGISSSNNSGSTSTMATSTTTGTNTNTTGSTSGSINLEGSTVMGTAGNISVLSPQAPGFAVQAAKVTVSAPTWLVVYEDNNGKPGNAIGAGLFFAGSEGGAIQLLRATQAGNSYLVGQSVDDGDKTFSLTSDKMVVDQNGSPLFTQFKAQ